jgi:Cu/Ag efflux protein CusF
LARHATKHHATGVLSLGRMHTPLSVLRTLALLGTLVTAIACNPSSGADTAPAIYRTRVQVVAIEGDGEWRRAQLKHEAIAAFKDRDGKAATMPAMTMAFGLGPGIDEAALKPGSKHEIAFDVVWNREPTLLLTQAKQLPDDTALVFEPHH